VDLGGGGDGELFDVIGIGALNVDHIVRAAPDGGTAPAARSEWAQIRAEEKRREENARATHAEWGTETLVDADTHPGANTLMGDHLDDAVTDYLARARVVHVTSFLDPVTPGRLLRVLRALKRARPDVLISVDPGHVWSVGRSADVLGIVALADVLLVNSRELRALAAAEMFDSFETVARKMMALMPGRDPLLLVKNGPSATSARRRLGRVRTGLHRGVPLRDDQIIDATGAGDVFAAGILAVLTRSTHHVTVGARLGHALARHGMLHIGTDGHAGFADLARQHWRE
jgi:sugar/nucleoside kinase (ribokinase family)